MDREITDSEADMVVALFSDDASQLRRQVKASIECWLHGETPTIALTTSASLSPSERRVGDDPEVRDAFFSYLDGLTEGSLSELELRYLHGDR
jgi:hypothetical protein